MHKLFALIGVILLAIFLIGIGPGIGAYIVHRQKVRMEDTYNAIQSVPAIIENAIQEIIEEYIEEYFEDDPLFCTTIPAVLIDNSTPIADGINLLAIPT